MITNALGKTRLEISRLGLGLAEIGEKHSLDATEATRELFDNALDAGINFLDTAACYGISEELVGAAASHRRSEFILATKAGHFVPRGEGEDWTAEVVTTSIERSLARMKTDYLDLVQLHSCSVEILERGEVIAALQQARDAGKTRFIGYSGDNKNAEWAVNSGLFDTLQTSFNLVDQRPRTRLLPRARKKGMGIIIKRPIANAVWGTSEDPNPYDNDYTAEYSRRALIMQGEGALPEEPDDRILTAMGFLFAHEEVDVAIIGTHNPRHMLSNIDLVTNRLPIPTETVTALYERYDRLAEDWEQKG